MRFIKFIILFIFLISKNVYSNEITLLHCYTQPTIQPEVFEINQESKKITYKEGPGVILDMEMKYKVKTNYIISEKSLLQFFDEITGDGDSVIADLEKQLKEFEQVDISNFDEEKLKLFKSVNTAMTDMLKYFKNAEVYFKFDKNLETLDITYSEPSENYTNIFGNSFIPANHYCLKAFMSKPNQPKNWIGFVIKVNDMIYHGEEKRRRMIFPLEQVYASEEQCYDDFGWLFQNDSQLMGRFPQTSDVNESYLFGCTETNN